MRVLSRFLKRLARSNPSWSYHGTSKSTKSSMQESSSCTMRIRWILARTDPKGYQLVSPPRMTERLRQFQIIRPNRSEVNKLATYSLCIRRDKLEESHMEEICRFMAIPTTSLRIFAAAVCCGTRIFGCGRVSCPTTSHVIFCIYNCTEYFSIKERPRRIQELPR